MKLEAAGWIVLGGICIAAIFTNRVFYVATPGRHKTARQPFPTWLARVLLIAAAAAFTWSGISLLVR